MTNPTPGSTNPPETPPPPHVAAAVRDWPTYFDRSVGKPARETSVAAADAFGERVDGLRAVDLGCGDGRDTIELLERGWRVWAIDASDDGIRRLRERDVCAEAEATGRLEVVTGSFEQISSGEIAIPGADLVNASFALPFCPPDAFAGVWEAIDGAIAPGGRFAGQLFGDRDGWAIIEDRSHQTRAEVLGLFDGWVLESFREEDRPGTHTGDAHKHWHVFHVIARRRAEPERGVFLLTDLALDLQDVAKTYRGKVRALRGMEMTVGRGEVFGLLGPNGAGKSTLVKILMTVIRPTRCKGTMLGDPVGRKATLARVGYLPEHHRFPGYLRGRQVLDFFGAMSGVGRADRRRRADELLELVGMTDWAKAKVGGYSKGMRQRLGIAQALMNDPDLVVLDEPTDGVDPVGRREIRDIVSRLRDEQKTVFINSHLLSELEMVCDRVAILVQGTVRSQGSLDELTEGKRRYEIQVDELADVRDAAVAAGQAAGLETTADMPRRMVVLPTDDAAAVQPAIDALRASGTTVVAVRPFRPSLEDLFIEAVQDPETGGTLKPGAARDKPGEGAH